VQKGRREFSIDVPAPALTGLLSARGDREVRRLKRNTLATLKEPLTGIGAAVDAVGGSFTMAYTAVVVTADIRTAGRRVREPGRCSHSG
jgi:hypothetical protein